MLILCLRDDKTLSPTMAVEQIPGGFKVLDANGQSLAYVYGRETKADADIAKVLTMAPALRATSPSCQRYSARARASNAI